MYRVVKLNGGIEIGITEKPYYIKKKASSGAFIPTDKENAQGIAFKGEAYNLQGKDGIGVDDTVILVECDAGDTATAVNELSDTVDNLIISILEG